ncbi:hypothetical protein PPH94_008320 [Burkholderia cepacia]|uniref:hypothetical protein n=1 Tax=Burkholderia cepacia TaxID=292 RepID=UPI00234B40A3|nr:hypothetical protein [Burkholderia cepacia]MDC6101774.1 hypothetical protein [Burkholderia cepacia]
MSWHHGDWLSFAQAVVSAAAILGAFGVVFVQEHLQKAARGRERDAERDVAHKIAVIFVARALETVEDLLTSLRIEDKAKYIPLAFEVLEDRRASIDRLNLNLLTPEAIAEVERARGKLTTLIAICRRIEAQELPKAEDHTIEGVRLLGESIRQTLAALRGRI